MKNDKLKFKEEFKKRLYKFVLDLIKFTGTLNLKDPVVKVIIDQLLRSGTSILANYIEGQAASSRKEFINFFHISLKSANETKVWLALLRDANRCDTEKVGLLLSELSEISNIFASSLLTLKGKKQF